jgi:uncharacterized protein YbjQ (UPF0145 family)
VDPSVLEVAVELGTPLLLLVIGYLTGTIADSTHYKSIRTRESKMRSMPAISFKRPPAHWTVSGSDMVTGSTVVSIDYFKRFLAGLRNFVGGRVKSYESLLDRSRREAILRMKEQARELGFDAVVNVRIETSRMASSSKGGKGTAGIEILAFGTAVKLAS